VSGTVLTQKIDRIEDAESQSKAVKEMDLSEARLSTEETKGLYEELGKPKTFEEMTGEELGTLARLEEKIFRVERAKEAGRGSSAEKKGKVQEWKRNHREDEEQCFVETKGIHV